MFSEFGKKATALFIWMFFTGDLLTVETLADFQKFLSRYGYSVCFHDNKVVFGGQILQPFQSRIKFVSTKKAVVYPQMGKAIEIEFKRGKLVTKDLELAA